MITADEARKLSNNDLNSEIVKRALERIEVTIKKECDKGKYRCSFSTDDIKVINELNLIVRALNRFGYFCKCRRYTWRNEEYATIDISW